MQKQIHVNSYVKRDGTRVRDYYRTIETNGNMSFIPEEQNFPGGTIDENKGNILYDMIPPITDFGLNVDTGSVPVLQGGVSASGIDWGSIGGAIGGVFGAVVAVGIELAPIALQMYEAAHNGNGQAVKYLKPQLDTKIKQLDTQLEKMKMNVDTSVKKLLKANSRSEYTKLYEPLQKNWQVYQQTANLVNRIKTHANNDDYKAVANDFENFTNNTQKKIISNLIQPALKLQNNSNDVKNLIDRYKLDDQLQSALKNNVSNVNYNADFSKLAKNNFLMRGNLKYNFNRPNAKEMANIFLAKPMNIPLSKEYSYIPKGNANIINLKYDLTGNKIIPQNWEGIVYNQYSLLSKNLSNSKELQEQIRNKFEIMNTNTRNDKLEVNFSQDSNLHLSIGHATILTPYINSDGYFQGILFDKYDFDWLEYYKSLGYKDNIFYIANDIFFIIQTINGHNFYILAPIIFKW
ncbi:hypothetical protein IJ579_05705 [bacterium]|nr:hypothetical protein [bacterium]